MSETFDLGRFIAAQDGIYDVVLSELRAGRKRSHWMWFIFPQIDGLATSPTSKRFAIKSVAEAKAYLDHPILGPRLVECAETILALEEKNAMQIFGYPDYLKLKSSMTLFAAVAGSKSLFQAVLDEYFNGEVDDRTIEILKEMQ